MKDMRANDSKLKMAVFWVVAPRNQRQVYRRFRYVCYLHQGDLWEQPAIFTLAANLEAHDSELKGNKQSSNLIYS
jgi:hypothetical protein